MNSTNSLEKEILSLEQRYWSAMKSNDIDAAVELTRFPAVVASPKGVMEVKEADYRKMMESQKPDQFKGVEIKDPKVIVLNEQTAILTYSTEMNSMKMLDTSTWVLKDNQWKCAFHSETPQH